MAEEIAKGNMQATTFANAAWKGIAEALRQRTGKQYTYLQLKNKYHNLRARWSDFSNLLREKDITYDSITGELLLLKMYGESCTRSNPFEGIRVKILLNPRKARNLKLQRPHARIIVIENAYKKPKLGKKFSVSPSLDSVADSGDGSGYRNGQAQDVDVVICMEALNSLEGIDGASYVKAA
ncbi:L10-interacting MYB domain-containing protein, partial [Bienertia sinuspersici]